MASEFKVGILTAHGLMSDRSADQAAGAYLVQAHPQVRRKSGINNPTSEHVLSRGAGLEMLLLVLGTAQD